MNCAFLSVMGFIGLLVKVEKSVQKTPCKVPAIIYNIESSVIIYNVFNCSNVHIVCYLLFLLLLRVISGLPY